MLGLSPEEEEKRTNRLEHSKFLLYQVQQELSLYPANKDCVLQCEDGSFWTSLPNMASISALVRNTCQVRSKLGPEGQRKQNVSKVSFFFLLITPLSALTSDLYRMWSYR